MEQRRDSVSKMRRKNVDDKFIKNCTLNAFKRLLDKKSYSEISIVEICKEASIGRTTFYRHFHEFDGKRDIILYWIGSTWSSFLESYAGNVTRNPSLVFLYYIESNKQLFSWLIREQLADLLFYVLFVTTKASESSNSYQDAYLSGAIFGVIYQWVKDEFSKSADQIYEMLMQSN